MMCMKIFWDNPYLKEMDTTVNSVNGNWLTLVSTIIYAFSGGQDSDSGTIDGYEVLEARKEGHEIYYRLPEGHGIKAGDLVHLVIDWDKRYRLMRLHFAAELVLEWVYQNYNHPEKIGANITQEKARVDFCWEGNINKIFPELEKAIERIVDANLEIKSQFSDKENELRYWEIEGIGRVPCGGTHLQRTGEIGKLKFKRTNTGSGKERIEIQLIE